MLLNIHELHKWEKTSLGLMTFRERREGRGGRGRGGHGGIDTRWWCGWGRGTQGCSAERGRRWHPGGGGREGARGGGTLFIPPDMGCWVQLIHAGSPRPPRGQILPFLLCNRKRSRAGGWKAAANSGGGVTIVTPTSPATSLEVGDEGSPKGPGYE